MASPNHLWEKQMPITFRIPELEPQGPDPITAVESVYVPAVDTAALFRLLQLPQLAAFTLQNDQLAGLRSAIADYLCDEDFEGLAYRMRHGVRTNVIAGSLLRVMRDISQLADYARQRGYSLEWVTHK